MQVDGIPDRLHMNVTRLAKASEQMKLTVSGLQQYIWLLSAVNHYSITDLHGLITKSIAKLCDEGHPEPIVTIAGDLPAMEADSEQLELLLYHVLSNAVKFKKSDRAYITVSGTVIKLNSFKAIQHKYKYDDFLKLDIRDEGVGFDPIYKDNVFELFKRLDNSNGQGLGLALCKKVAENHAGSIEAYSKVNDFTTITVYLPLIQRTNP
jgi:signal transduction histidine kinase